MRCVFGYSDGRRYKINVCFEDIPMADDIKPMLCFAESYGNQYKAIAFLFNPMANVTTPLFVLFIAMLNVTEPMFVCYYSDGRRYKTHVFRLLRWQTQPNQRFSAIAMANAIKPTFVVFISMATI